MRLQRIYSSKLYITSSRKDQIDETINNPYNKELVQQMSDYLDDQGQEELEEAVIEVQKDTEAPAENTSGGEAPAAESSSSHAPMGGGGAGSFTGDVLSDFGEDELADIEIPEDAGSGETESEAPAAEPEPVAESTSVAGTPITASCCVIWTTLDDVVSDCDTIKGTLNSIEATKGVSRLQVKDSELWIYYNDDVNLNDKMVDVIDVLNSTGYTYLVFNRLARSNNAIVFDITLNIGETKPEKELEEDNK